MKPVRLLLPVALFLVMESIGMTASGQQGQAPSSSTDAAAMPESWDSPRWMKEIGKLKYDEVLKLEGLPTRLIKRKDGTETAVWERMEQIQSANKFPQTTTFNGSGNTAQPAPASSGVQGFHTERLTLDFNKNGVLKKWNYRS